MKKTVVSRQTTGVRRQKATKRKGLPLHEWRPMQIFDLRRAMGETALDIVKTQEKLRDLETKLNRQQLALAQLEAR